MRRRIESYSLIDSGIREIEQPSSGRTMRSFSARGVPTFTAVSTVTTDAKTAAGSVRSISIQRPGLTVASCPYSPPKLSEDDVGDLPAIGRTASPTNRRLTSKWTASTRPESQVSRHLQFVLQVAATLQPLRF